MPFTTLKNAVLREKIDWIAYTQPISLDWELPPYIDSHWKDIRPLPHYNKAQENKQGIRRYWNTENAKQGRYIVASSAACDLIGESLNQYLQFTTTSRRKATRIDFALDITNCEFHPRQVSRRLRRGEAVTHAETFLAFHDFKSGAYTQYVGTKSSETYSRIYDKQVEQKASFAWTRVETVFQGSRAKPALEEYQKYKSVRPLIKSHIDFPKWKDWNEIMSSDVAKLKIPEKISNTRTWLLSTVVKALAKEIHQDEDHSFWFEFSEAVHKELDRLETES
jgi:hypothetical protein